MQAPPAVRPAVDPATILPLRIVFVAVPFLAGLDKFCGVLADWQGYLAPFVRTHLPVAPGTFLAIVGLVEMSVGVLVATRLVRPAAYAAAAWLLLVALQLLAGGHIDVAVRDVALAVAAGTLARLSPAPTAAAHGRAAARRPAEVHA